MFNPALSFFLHVMKSPILRYLVRHLAAGSRFPLSPSSPVSEHRMEKRILGLDPGLATLGFGAVLSDSTQPNSSLAVLDFGIIQTPAKQEIGDRLCIIYDDLNSLLNYIQPDLVAIEKLFFYKMGNTIAVAQARGVVMLVLAQMRLPFVEFTPAQVKQALTGHGILQQLADVALLRQG